MKLVAWVGVASTLAVLAGACGTAARKDETSANTQDDNGGSGAAGGAGTADTSACPRPQDAPGGGQVTYLPGVTVTTIAGGAAPGNVDGAGAAASFSNPVSVLLEKGGTLVVCDFDDDLLRRVDPNAPGGAAVTTLTRQSAFTRPFGLTLGADGAIFVDTDYNPAGEKTRESGTVWRVDAATGAATVVSANLGRPRGLATRADGQLVLGDYQNGRVRLLDPVQASVEDLVGAGMCAVGPAGERDQPPFAMPYGVVVLPTAGGTIVVADADNHQLRTVTPVGGTVSPFAGGWSEGTADGPAASARFARPTALAVDAAGNVYVSDVDAHRIRRVGTDGTVVTIAGDGTAGFRDGAGAEAELYGQEGIAVTPDGHTLYVADGTAGEMNVPYHRLRKIVIP